MTQQELNYGYGLHLPWQKACPDQDLCLSDTTAFVGTDPRRALHSRLTIDNPAATPTAMKAHPIKQSE